MSNQKTLKQLFHVHAHSSQSLKDFARKAAVEPNNIAHNEAKIWLENKEKLKNGPR